MRFEELRVRKGAQELINELGSIFYASTFRNYSFQDQIMRAILSVSNNIAEGNERGSGADFIRFLYYAKGSIGETRSMLYSASTFGYITKEQFQGFTKKCFTISTQISNLITTLKKLTMGNHVKPCETIYQAKKFYTLN